MKLLIVSLRHFLIWKVWQMIRHGLVMGQCLLWLGNLPLYYIKVRIIWSQVVHRENFEEVYRHGAYIAPSETRRHNRNYYNRLTTGWFLMVALWLLNLPSSHLSQLRALFPIISRRLSPFGNSAHSRHEVGLFLDVWLVDVNDLVAFESLEVRATYCLEDEWFFSQIENLFIIVRVSNFKSFVLILKDLRVIPDFVVRPVN